MTNMSTFTGNMICDIKRDTHQGGFQGQIVDSLKAVPPSMPSLLLWNDDGLKLFDALTQTTTYYPPRKEVEILNRYAGQIVASIPPESLLIELGCG
jgi:uncharacterized SAM-dependent methyltransferase